MRFPSLPASTLFLACLAPTGIALAQNAACASAPTTAAMRSCEGNRLDKANANLAAVYDRLFSQLGTSSRVKLKASEAAWLLYRKAEADFQADAAQGGTLAPLLRTTTLADLTEARSASLGKSIHP